MSKTVFFFGADAPYAKRIINDLVAKGFYVYAAASDEAALAGIKGDNISTVVVDPLCQDSLNAAAEKVEKLDMVVLNFQKDFDAGTFGKGLNYDVMLSAYDYQTLSPLRALKALLPKLHKGDLKRICYITNEMASNNLTMDANDFAAHMTLAPIDMQAKTLFNHLRPEGFSFRLYARSLAVQDGSADGYAAEHFTRDLSYDADEDYMHNDENRIVLRDYRARELPW